MQLFPKCADFFNKGLFHEGVDIFVSFFERWFIPLHFPFYLCEGINDPGCLFMAYDLLFGQHPAMGHAALYVLGIKPIIKSDGGVKSFNYLIHILLKTASPNFLNHEYFLILNSSTILDRITGLTWLVFFNPVDRLVQIPGPDLATIILLPIGDIYWE